MVAWQTDRGTLSLLSERANFEHGNVRLRLSVRLRVRLRRVHKADLCTRTSSSQISSSENFKFRNPEKKLTKNCFFLFQEKNILDTAFCLFTHYSIAKLRAWMELNVVF